MSNINKNNYEAFLLDYLEQNLAPDMVAELRLFLEQNPALKQELDEMEELAIIEASTIEFPNKAGLKKEGLENLMIAEVEGINTPAASKELQKTISQDKEAAKALALYHKTILQPENIVFAHKADLKHKEGKVIPLYWWAASVAAILIMVFLLRGVNNTNNEAPSNFANNEKKEVGSQKSEDRRPKTEESDQPSAVSEEQLASSTKTEEQPETRDKKQSTKHHAPIPQDQPETLSPEFTPNSQHPTLNTELEEKLATNSQKSEDRRQKTEESDQPSAVSEEQLASGKKTEEQPETRDKKQSTKHHAPIPQDQPETLSPELATNTQHPTTDTQHSAKDSITIVPMEEEEVLLAENQPALSTTPKQPLTLPQYLKKELNKKVLKNNDPEEKKSTEVVVADILAKAAGKRGSVDKTKNDEGEVEEYALNIGGFSFSRKVRK